MQAFCITARHEAWLFGWDKDGAKRSLPCILIQDMQMHTQNTDSHIWRSLRLNSSRNTCVLYRIGSTATLKGDNRLSHQQKCQVYIQQRHVKLAELLRLWTYCQTIIVRPHAQDTLCNSAVKLTGTSFVTSCAAVPHSHLCGHRDDRHFLFSLKVVMLWRWT